MSSKERGYSLPGLLMGIAALLVLILGFWWVVRFSINDTRQETADANAEECYRIATTRYADKDYGFVDSDIYEGCIILTSNGNYFVEKKYGGSKDIIEVYWFENTDNWSVAYGKLTNFDEVIEQEEVYGTYQVHSE